MTASERIRKERKTREAQALTATQTTEQLLAAFTITDRLMEEGLNEDDFFAVATSRGFIMEELVRRGQIDLLDPSLT